MKALNSIEDLVEEIKIRVVWWALFVFCVTYFLSYSSKSMWMNLPISILLVSMLRILMNNVEFRWKSQKLVRPQSYLSHLEKKQLSLNYPRLSTGTPPPKWKRKIGSPIVEDAVKDFIDKLLKDFVIDLWYSDITPDKEAPEQIRAIIMDALGEVSGRVKEINLVDLLTRDIIDLIGDHIELFRKNQAAIGVDVMKTLSSEERDERLKHHLMASKELHPAMISPESEYKEDPLQPRPADWARVLEAATQRRTEVLAPENLENMWTKGRNYKKKEHKKRIRRVQEPISECSGIDSAVPAKNLGNEMVADRHDISTGMEDRSIVKLRSELSLDTQLSGGTKMELRFSLDPTEESYADQGHLVNKLEDIGNFAADGNKSRLKRSNSTSALKIQPDTKRTLTEGGGSIISEFYSPEFGRHREDHISKSASDMLVHCVGQQVPKLRCRDLLSIANVAEQHEVWDFLSGSSKNYSFGKSPSVMRTLAAVNVDDAVDDIVRQFKGVSDGLMRKVVGSPMSEASSLFPGWNLSGNADETGVLAFRQNTAESTNSFSDNEEGTLENGWHSDNELNYKGYPPRVVRTRTLGLEKKADLVGKGGFLEDPIGMPPEWTPPNVSVPLLNLVDKVFQLKRRGWLRRQVFWMSKQILQLMMDDAIDDWLMRQIHWLRREDIIASGIYWLKDVLWPNGTFFLRVGNVQDGNQNPFQNISQFDGSKAGKPGSFEQQLEAARRASDIKKMLFDGTPAPLVSLIGHKQYRRCARDIYYFIQSTICIKQLAYAILELSLVSIFPELRDLIVDVHQKMGVDQTV
ncbi:hypothetical protein C1H46_012442 [Malus baccata]|uniref:PXA domain-containing protein n=1 Tax=Malus baccata TaxID=106549 RepID=A0A540MT24_MALBA|nr:hypothetical protein C1H46_012442 [Malus baccata]